MTKGRKLRVGLLFGGRSGEHEVSLTSAASVLQALDPAKYEVVPIGITREGGWLIGSAGGSSADGLTAVLDKGRRVPPFLHPARAKLLTPDPPPGSGHSAGKLALIFPLPHG